MDKNYTIPKISKPANRALIEAGITDLRQLQNVTKADLLALHGFGPKGIRVLEESMAQLGLIFKQ